MVRLVRDRFCEYTFCIRTALASCKKCDSWFCKEHYLSHVCETVRLWRDLTPVLQQLRASDVEIDKEGKVTFKSKKKPSRRDWHGVIDR